MEDDDEFGDLYTDVLRPFASSSSSEPQAQPSSAAPQSSSRPIDLNLNTDDDEILRAAPHSNSAAPHHSIDQTKVPSHRDAVQESLPAAAAPNLIEMNEQRAEKEEESAEVAGFTRLGVVELIDRSLQDLNRGRESAIDDGRNEVGVKGVDLLDKDVKFDIEEDGNGIEDVDSEPIIPGLSTDAGGGDGGGSVLVAATGAEPSRKVDESGDRGEGDDWDSDSDDDLQIVLNDNNHMAMERGGMVGDDDDEDEDGLVIVADGDPNQAAEEQDWGEDTAQPADGERKDTGESAKATGGMAVAPKVGYSNHGYHPFHSQFKVSVLCCLKGNHLYVGFFVSPSFYSMNSEKLECNCSIL